MPDWLDSATGVTSPIPALTMAARIAMAVLFGAAIASIYRVSHGREARETRTLGATLVLLTALLAMVSMVIGESVARAFGLVGALSIVRFRTVVEDTRDTAFVIFAVIVGMAAGTGLLLVPLIGVPIVGTAAVALSRQTAGRSAPGAGAATGAVPMTLTVRLGLGRDPTAVLGGALSRHTRACRLVAVATARQGAAIDLNYTVTLAATDAAAALVLELNAIEGVQNVELRGE